MTVTKDNLPAAAHVLDALRKNLKWLKLRTKHYPVIYRHDGFSFVFRSPQEVDRLIASLDRQIEAIQGAVSA